MTTIPTCTCVCIHVCICTSTVMSMFRWLAVHSIHVPILTLPVTCEIGDTHFIVLPKVVLNLCITFAQISRVGPECSVFDKQRVNEGGAMDSLCHNHTQEGWQLHHGTSVSAVYS